MYNERKETRLSFWVTYTVSIFDILDGHTTSKKNPWRLGIILLSAAVFATLFISMLYFKTFLVYPRISRASSLPDVTQILNDYLQFIVYLYFVNKYDRDACAEYYQQYTLIDNFLRKQSEREIKQKLAKLIVVFAVIWVVNFATHYATLWYEYYWQYPIIFVPFHVFVCTKILTTLFLSAHTIRIECRLQMISDLVEDIYCIQMGSGWQNVNVLNENCEPNSKQKLFLKMHDRVPFSKSQLSNSNDKISRLSKMYLILTEQCEFVNNMHGIRILLLSLNLTIDMVRFINSLYRYVGGKQLNYLNRTAYSLAAASTSRTLVCMVTLFGLVHHCERAYRQSDRLARLCDRMLFTSTNAGEEVRASISELRELVMSRPISFTVARFFRLEYPALTAIAATVVSYSIILFQSM